MYPLEKTWRGNGDIDKFISNYLYGGPKHREMIMARQLEHK